MNLKGRLLRALNPLARRVLRYPSETTFCAAPGTGAGGGWYTTVSPAGRIAITPSRYVLDDSKELEAESPTNELSLACIPQGRIVSSYFVTVSSDGRILRGSVPTDRQLRHSLVPYSRGCRHALAWRAPTPFS